MAVVQSTARKARTSRRARVRHFFDFPVAAALLAISPPAVAYSTSSVVTDGCHERITMDALRRVRSELPGAGFVAPNEKSEL